MVSVIVVVLAGLSVQAYIIHKENAYHAVVQMMKQRETLGRQGGQRVLSAASDVRRTDRAGSRDRGRWRSTCSWIGAA